MSQGSRSSGGGTRSGGGAGAGGGNTIAARSFNRRATK
jgi:hypothetical protein